MKLTRKTPLAWKNLTHDWRRLLAALCGIAFAVLLMFTQVGFQNALFDSQVQLIDELNGEIFIVNRAKYTLAAEKRFSIDRINQARSVPGVRSAFPLYTDLTASVLRRMQDGLGNRGYPLRSIGFNLDEPAFAAQEVNDQTELLRMPNTGIIDRKSKQSNFNFPMNDPAALRAEQVELNGQSLRLVGTFSLGTDFAHDGNLLMSAESFARFFSHRKPYGDPLSVVDIGIVMVDPQADLQEVQQLLQTTLEKDVFVYTRDEFRRAEIHFWDRSTPIGAIFLAGKIIGFIVGMVICYQVIFSDIADHMPEFATLKAMGYSTRYFFGLILMEALLLSIIGFVPGAIASNMLYEWLSAQTGLLMQMTFDVILFVLFATVAMCVASGMLAVRKLLAADPATLF